MNLILFDNVLANPDKYVQEILKGDFIDVPDGDKVFKGIQPRSGDAFERYVLANLPGFEVAYNFVRKSPLNQVEPNFIHTDEMMGSVTALLYLSKEHPKEDGTTFYEEDGSKSLIVHSKFNRAVIFDADVRHSRNIFENFGEGDSARLVQVIFLKES